jgi:hypothetical protein
MISSGLLKNKKLWVAVIIVIVILFVVIKTRNAADVEFIGIPSEEVVRERFPHWIEEDEKERILGKSDEWGQEKNERNERSRRSLKSRWKDEEEFGDDEVESQRSSDGESENSSDESEDEGMGRCKKGIEIESENDAEMSDVHWNSGREDELCSEEDREYWSEDEIKSRFKKGSEKSVEKESDKKKNIKNRRKKGGKKNKWRKNNGKETDRTEGTKRGFNEGYNEHLCRKFLEEHFYPHKFPNTRPSWLVNPETGRCLELDAYNQTLGIALEYNGAQHYSNNTPFHKNVDEFLRQVRRDKFKLETCDKEGVYLITVPHTVDSKKIPDYIKYYLPENYENRIKIEAELGLNK